MIKEKEHKDHRGAWTTLNYTMGGILLTLGTIDVMLTNNNGIPTAIWIGSKMAPFIAGGLSIWVGRVISHSDTGSSGLLRT
ncbi:MAG: hypothetical protein M1360_01110 [Candidatus Marsarchaeota archaeon]|jgi:hypothetical protein|nr:hypothetical protein [Candidatus Marsarchaeota archaeon]MCL5418521.1 hypothetical protein [Candidatus Marsarchaeota archaeon]